MADIFISYAREDRPRVIPIAKAFEDQGWSVWWDTQIPPGKTFFSVIKEALDAAKCVVVLWSKQSIDSEWVLLDQGMRPRLYVNNEFKDNADGTVTDHATGLMWQKSGSSNYLPYEKAQEYIDQLNRERFAGHLDWRLPTMPELMSLLTPQKQTNTLFIDPVFYGNQRWCWSADERAAGSAWGVGFHRGDVRWGDLLLNYYYVRGVRS